MCVSVRVCVCLIVLFLNVPDVAVKLWVLLGSVSSQHGTDCFHLGSLPLCVLWHEEVHCAV